MPNQKNEECKIENNRTFDEKSRFKPAVPCRAYLRSKQVPTLISRTGFRHEALRMSERDRVGEGLGGVRCPARLRAAHARMNASVMDL